jgi:glycosyltransferase involved in cell wall biosynthesis
MLGASTSRAGPADAPSGVRIAVRIAHVSDFYLPRLGGIEMHVADLAERQRRQGHEVQVVTSTPGPAQPGVHRVTMGFRRPSALHPLAAVEGVRTLRAMDVDVVHAHLGVGSPLAFLLARSAARWGLPTVVTVHSMWAGVAPIVVLADALGGWSRLPIAWTAVSEAAAAPVRPHLGGGPPMAILPNGIEQGQWRMPPAPDRPDQLNLVAVMRLAARKRPLPLLRMVRHAQETLRRSGDPTRLRLSVAGEGPLRGAMERYLLRHGMSDSVDLVGRLDHAGVRDLLSRGHVFLAPADLESFGIAALEARCAGLPVVARQRGGIGEFVAHEREGLLCGSDPEMEAAVVRLARDPQLRHRIAAHNRTTDAQVAWESVLAATDGVYEQARHLQRSAARSRRAGFAALVKDPGP